MTLPSLSSRRLHATVRCALTLAAVVWLVAALAGCDVLAPLGPPRAPSSPHVDTIVLPLWAGPLVEAPPYTSER